MCLLGQNEIERACDLLFKKAESIDYRYEVHDRAVEGLLILPLYGSMSTGESTEGHFIHMNLSCRSCYKHYPHQICCWGWEKGVN